MSFQSFTFSIPPNTTRQAPLVQNFNLWLPVVESITVQIPPGHKGLAEMEIRTPGYLLMDGIRGDDQVKQSGRLAVKMFGPPYYIICTGWNASVFLTHEFVIEVINSE